MRWTPSGRGTGSGGGGLPLPGGRRGGLGGALLLLLVLGAMWLGGGSILGGGSGYGIDVPLDPFPQAPPADGGAYTAPDGERDLVEFLSFVLDDNQRFWERQFAAAGRRYEEAQLVLFRRGVMSGCGPASSESGPFYCPADRSVYADLSFFRELELAHGAPGDFAQAYVLAHEVAHHVQNLLGVTEQVAREGRSNELSVRTELQADCLAGVWGYSTYERGLLEPGDLEEGLGAAAAVGDDRLGARSPETWTHGSSELRVRWFERGYESGRMDACDTFSGDL